jgi:hypothetical protein
LLRVVLIGEIIRADEATLYAMADLFQTLGLLETSDEKDGSRPEVAAQGKRGLRLVK